MGEESGGGGGGQYMMIDYYGITFSLIITPQKTPYPCNADRFLGSLICLIKLEESFVSIKRWSVYVC